MTKIIGVTGGVGAGKSTVLDILRNEYNAEIILADKVAHQLMEKGEICYQKIVEQFGKEILTSTGELDKEKLGTQIFAKAEIKEKINSIVHPIVKERLKTMIASSKKELIIIEAALFIEAGYRDLCDECWYVYVSTQERVKRLYEQRGYSEVKSYSIIQNQLSHSQFRKSCEYLIDNGGSIEDTHGEVARIMRGEGILCV